MKYLLLILFIGCAKTPVKQEPSKPAYVPRSERIKTCVHELLVKDVKAVDSLKICDRIYRGEL